MSARRLFSAVFVTVFGALVFASTSALAAAPEAPGVTVQFPASATTAVVHGVLDPGKEGSPGTFELGTYEFLYKTSKTECEGEGKAPSSPGISLGGGKEEVVEELTGLVPGTEYAVCLLARSGIKGEQTLSTVVTFKTASAPQTPEALKAELVGPVSATLHGVLNPTGQGEAGSYEFLYSASATDCQGGGAIGDSAQGQAKEAVSSEVKGLSPNTEYTFCLLTRNEAGETALSSPVTFTTLSQTPSISGETVSKLGSTSATASVHIDTGGLQVSYVVQYGTTDAYGAETAAASMSPGMRTVTVALTELQPNTEYHFRFVATNAEGSQTGADTSFTTYPAGAGILPDNRVYEMVTSAENLYDSNVYEVDSGLLHTPLPFQSSVSGDAVVYAGFPASGGTGSSGIGEGNSYRATRSPNGRWAQVNITPADASPFVKYEAFSSDLSIGIIKFETELPLPTAKTLVQPPEPSEGKRGYEDIYGVTLDDGLFHPFFTARPPYRPIIDANDEDGFLSFRVLKGGISEDGYAGSSADLSDVLFEANDTLLEGEGKLEKELDSYVQKEVEEASGVERLYKEHRLEEAAALEGLAKRNELYESVDGHLGLVNVLPDGSVAPGATFGSSNSPYFDGSDFSHVISADGSRIFWTDMGTSFGQAGIVYAREGGSRTVRVSEGSAQFWTASVDGRYVFYTEDGKLWRFDVDSETREEIAGSQGGVQGVVGINETGEDDAFVYFVTQEVLTGEENMEKQKGVAGGNNLYVSEPDAEQSSGRVTRFIGTLSSGDRSDWAPSIGARTAEVASDGHGLVFTSASNLTGHSYPGEGSPEVYSYQTESSRLFCASCRPQASGGYLPTTGSVVYMYRWISEDGSRVFFESKAPLVDRDVNGTTDVYEWERDGAGSCDETEGCVYLISDGLESTAFFADASANGDNVFIATRQRLVPEDQNEIVDLYDARVDGSLPVAPPVCSGTGCQGPPAPAPVFATPSSVTFNGAGNFPTPTSISGSFKARSLTRAQKLSRVLATCHKKQKKKQRTICESHARKLYGAKAKKSATKRAR